MGRGETGLQARVWQSFSIVIRFSVPLIVLIWMAAALTDTNTGMSAASNFHSMRQSPHGSIVKKSGPGREPLRGMRADAIDGNWSGYVVTGSGYISAQGTWTVPAISYVPYPDGSDSETSSTWIGIGGYNEPTLIQLGTNQTVNKSGVATYAVWYEILPAVQTTIDATQFVVSPGDTIAASIQCTAACTPNAQSTWVMSMTNGSRWKTAFSIQLTYPSSLASAEWIMEATCMHDCSTQDAVQGFAYLPKFDPTTFSAISANNANPNLSRMQNAIMITDPNGKAESIPTDPVGGNSFTVKFAMPGSS